MGNPITITVVAQGTEQSAAKIASFANASTASLKTTSRALTSFAGNLALNASFFAGPMAQQFVYPVVLFSKELKGLHAALKLTGAVSLGAGAAGLALGAGMIGLTGIVASATQGWKAHTAALRETAAAQALVATQGRLTSRLFNLIDDAVGAGKLSRADGEKLADLLMNPTFERIRLVQSKLRDLYPNMDQGKSAGELLKIQEQLRIANLEGLDKEKAEAANAYGERIKQIDAELAGFKNFQQLRSAMIDAGRGKEVDGIKSIADYRKRLADQANAEFLARTSKAAAQAAEQQKQAEDAAAKLAQSLVSADIVAFEQKLTEEAANFSGNRIELADHETAKRKKFYQSLVDTGQISEAQMTEALRRGSLDRINILEDQARLEARIRGAAGGPLAQLDSDEAAEKAEVDKTITDHTKAEELKTLITQKYAEARLHIAESNAEAEKQIRQIQIQGVHTMFGNMAAAAKIFGAKGFAVAKGFAIAQATMDTAQAAIAAYRATVGIPYIGPILAPIAAAAAVAAGAAQIATISAQQPAGYAAGGRPPVGDLAIVGERGPELFIADRPGTILPATATATMMSRATGGSPVSGAGSDSRRELRFNLYPILDKKAALELLRDDIEGIALEVFRRRTV